jgi:hypothetical protein
VVFVANVANAGSVSPFIFSPNASGDATSQGSNATFAVQAVPMPVACTFDSMYVYPSIVPQSSGVGGSMTITLLIGTGTGGLTPATTALTTTATSGTYGSSASTTGNITGQSVAVTAGQLIAVQATGTGVTSGSDTISVSMHCK